MAFYTDLTQFVIYYLLNTLIGNLSREDVLLERDKGKISEIDGKEMCECESVEASF